MEFTIRSLLCLESNFSHQSGPIGIHTLFGFCLPMWSCGPTRAMASSFLRFLDHTQRLITVSRTPLDKGSAHRWDLYLTTHNTHKRQTSMRPRDSKSQSQHASDSKPTFYTAEPLGSTIYLERNSVNMKGVITRVGNLIVATIYLQLIQN